jgi:E3 ubiquitin-protein ligase mind-bomb
MQMVCLALGIFYFFFTGVRHQNIVCDACKKQDIMGMRWTCLKCKDYDLCSQCYMADKHETNHSFLRIDHPGIPG